MHERQLHTIPTALASVHTRRYAHPDDWITLLQDLPANPATQALRLRLLIEGAAALVAPEPEMLVTCLELGGELLEEHLQAGIRRRDFPRLRKLLGLMLDLSARLRNPALAAAYWPHLVSLAPTPAQWQSSAWTLARLYAETQDWQGVLALARDSRRQAPVKHAQDWDRLAAQALRHRAWQMGKQSAWKRAQRAAQRAGDAWGLACCAWYLADGSPLPQPRTAGHFGELRAAGAAAADLLQRILRKNAWDFSLISGRELSR